MDRESDGPDTHGRNSFPSPSNFLEWTEKEELKVALNLHPASGVEPFEAQYEAFAADYGWDKQGEGVPFRMSQE